MFSYLRTPTTWHCPHSTAARRCCNNRSIYPARRAHSSKPAAAGLPLWIHVMHCKTWTYILAKASNALRILVLRQEECFEKTAKNRSAVGGGRVDVSAASSTRENHTGTDRRTDTVPFHRPCSAYCADSADKALLETRVFTRAEC